MISDILVFLYFITYHLSLITLNRQKGFISLEG